MLFTTPVFIFYFLPIVFLGYFLLNKKGNIKLAQWYLILASLYFYAYWNYKYLILIIALIGGNYICGELIRKATVYKKQWLVGGILFNVFSLAYFKYTDFFITTVNTVFSQDIPLLNILLPLAISFCTFQQIAYLVDVSRGEVGRYGIRSYFLFVSFFPQLIAGPIVHHKEMMPQFDDINNHSINYKNILLGLCVFGIGVFKKTAIADNLSIWVDAGFASTSSLDFWLGWRTSLSYTFQLYYDFSGYVDMAIGLALLFNIRLPSNFNSPYKATNIQEFWRSWHMTLSRWMRDYLYIPLGGSRMGSGHTLFNLFIVALISGVWHGAGWGFVVWGALHGGAMVIHRLWQMCGYKMHKLLGWLLTFLFVNFAWVFFRAPNFVDAKNILKAMLGFNGGVCVSITHCSYYQMYQSIITPETWFGRIQLLLTIPWFMLTLTIILVMTLVLKNTTALYNSPRVSNGTLIISSILFAIGVIAMLTSSSSVFLYFNF